MHYSYNFTPTLYPIFFGFLSEPLKLTSGINFFGDIRDFMADQILDRILVNTVFLRHRNKVFPAVVRAMLRVQIQLISYSAKRLLVACIGELYIFAPVPRIEPVKEILAANTLGFFIFSFDNGANSLMDRDRTV